MNTLASREHKAGMMLNAFVRKLSQRVDLSEDDHRALGDLIRPTSVVKRGWHLFRERDAPKSLFIIVEGWAYRYKVLADGRRQIVGLLVPGDLCDLHASLLDTCDHSVAMLGSGRVVAIVPETMQQITDSHPAIARALDRAALVDQAVLREWLTSLGQRDAFSRIAHLFCELWTRVTTVGLAKAKGFAFPLTQTDLGDALGLTSVHVNRQLQLMRKAGLITLERQRLTIHDPMQLASLCGFDANYLQINGNGGLDLKSPPGFPARPRDWSGA